MSKKPAWKPFSVSNPNGKGLALYLKDLAGKEEESHFSRTYVVSNKSTKEVAAYFSLRAGFVSVPIEGTAKFDSYPGIELEAIAVNDESFVHSHIKPKFDDECIFMYQSLH